MAATLTARVAIWPEPRRLQLRNTMAAGPYSEVGGLGVAGARHLHHGCGEAAVEEEARQDEHKGNSVFCILAHGNDKCDVLALLGSKSGVQCQGVMVQISSIVRIYSCPNKIWVL